MGVVLYQAVPFNVGALSLHYLLPIYCVRCMHANMPSRPKKTTQFVALNIPTHSKRIYPHVIQLKLCLHDGNCHNFKKEASFFSYKGQVHAKEKRGSVLILNKLLYFEALPRISCR